MMTKAELFRMLEPFTDDIEIIGLLEGNYKCDIRLFYYTDSASNAQIIVATNYTPHGRAVELKVS